MAEIEKVINRQNGSTTHRVPATYTDGDSSIEEEKERYIIGTCAGTQRKQLGAVQQRVDRGRYLGNYPFNNGLIEVDTSVTIRSTMG